MISLERRLILADHILTTREDDALQFIDMFLRLNGDVSIDGQYSASERRKYQKEAIRGYRRQLLGQRFFISMLLPIYAVFGFLNIALAIFGALRPTIGSICIGVVILASAAILPLGYRLKARDLRLSVASLIG